MSQPSIAHVASSIMEFRTSLQGHVLSSGHLVPLIGEDGLNEALRRRWLIIDESGLGTLSINRSEAALISMTEVMSDPQQMDTGDQIQYVGRDGRVYDGVIRNVSPDKKKTTIAFTRGAPPDYRDGQEYDAKDVKVTKKTAPDARNDASRPSVSAPTSPTPAPNVFNGLSR